MSNTNAGVYTLNGTAAALPYKTLLVLGAGRGGTSMVAGTLAKLGIFMGENLSSYYEDGRLANCLTQNNKQQAKAIIQQRNQQYAVWGFKKPSLRLWFWLKLFREPVYIVVFRDIFATANRRVVSLDKSLLTEMLKITLLNLGLVLLLRLTKRPVLMLSYEKTLLNPGYFVTELCQFLGLANPVKLRDAIEFINPSPSAYTEKAAGSGAENRPFIGYVDAVTSRQILGWALSTQQSAVLEIEFWLNGQRQQTVLANLPRPDVAAANANFAENCGFSFDLPEDAALKTGDRVEVRIAQHNIQLINSPQTFVA